MITDDEHALRSLYASLLDAWNKHDAARYAGLFAEDGSIVGFDGSQVNGRRQIGSHLSSIFADHVTSAYIGIVREVRPLGVGAALLRAVAGMTPPGQTQINPAVNTIQTMVAEQQAGEWRIVLFQNTPAQFHGRPDLAQQLTDELQRVAQARPS